MGVSGECAVKGSKSQPCHCCASHVVASPSASVQQQHQQQLQQHHHHQLQQQQHQRHNNHHHHHHHHEVHHAIHPNHHHHHHHHQDKNNVPVEVQHNGDNSNILAPLRSKMKVLKKLKRKMGLGEQATPTNLFFLYFSFPSYCSLTKLSLRPSKF